MSLKLLNNNMNENEELIEPDKLIKLGIDTIYQSYKSNIGNYIDQIKEQNKIINELTKKLELIKEEMGMIKRENQYYKVQNEKLKNEIEKLNKVVNSIKGKLTKFDFKINNKRIIENISQKNLNSDKNNNLMQHNPQKAYINFKKYFKKDNYTIINTQYDNNNFNREKSLKNLEKNYNKRKHDIKYLQIKDINESDINNVDNNIDIEQELNIDNFQKNFNVENINYINNEKRKNYNIKNHNQKQTQTQTHNIYSHFRNKLEDDQNDLSDIIDTHFQHNTINIKVKNNNKNFNKENIILKKNTNTSLDDLPGIILEKKNSNINFNSNKSEKELIIQKKKQIDKNKIRSNSSNNVIQRENHKNEIKNLTNRNNGKEDILLIFKDIPLLQGIENIEYNNQICQTYQNQKNLKNIIINKDNINGNVCLKELKMKEMSFFLKKCKVYLDQITFEKIVKLFQDYKNETINDNDIIQKINHYLKNNSELLNLFNNIIS